MPNAVLLQHTNSIHYDLLIISEPLSQEYRYGVPHLGSNVSEVIQSISNLEIVNDYGKIRTVGCSAGGHIAVIAGYKLDAELAVGVAAILHKISQPKKYFERIFSIWNGVRKGNCIRVMLTYAKGEKRDKHGAKIISLLTGGNQIIIEYKDDKIGHDIFKRLVEFGELSTFLARTIYVEIDDEKINNQFIDAVLKLL